MRSWRAAAVVGVVGLTALGPALPAAAHGAVQRPASRGYACGPEGAASGAAACAAARAAADVQDWDNLRVADVAGRDREVIPDGRLCSAGIDRYRGLDLARADWPASRLSPGAALTVRYRTTIPHRGTFRLYVTNDRYSPTRPLRWSDLETRPFLSATDPAVVDGAYTLSGRLPADRTGRQLIYTIWQNSDTPDTYYSCSDVDFGTGTGTGTGTGQPPARGDSAAEPGADAAGSGSGAAPSARAADPVPAASARPDAAYWIGAVALGVVGLAGLVLVALRRRPR
ncbi:hypothetical protein GCM10010124_06360 [Pilimelia terevasa]|uniref:Chitin-binding type-4 domain-containing protein n=1 Tax=Pilimelia terevasa TaxID=53372 RepID=A0A8J3FEP3_9ACTN|nr:lytic polysaccharide monooxygenase [Pilimelia terevasa]GGK16486.1 hypothetical protein GCM10010124_06360 [Pilimelia terevasa]